MNTLKITVTDPGNPYRDIVVNRLSQDFPANVGEPRNVLEAITTALMASSKVRFGPVPSPESLVAIRKVIASSIEAGEPIPILCPWGSKKPGNDSSVDVAELGALKTLACLQKRVKPVYQPGIKINLRVEDIGGYYLFADEGDQARRAGQIYVSDLIKLVRVLDLDFINIKLESQMMEEAAYVALAESIRSVLVRYITDTDAHGFNNYSELESWQQLLALGWQGMIPKEQRDYYRASYAKLYSGIDLRGQTEKLATYLAGSLARYKLRATGAEEIWGSNFIQLNFAPPAPGTPASIGDRRIYYRTMPETLTRTHIPPWRARGYLKITDDGATPKIASWTESLPLEPCMVRFDRDGEVVEIRADQLVA